MEINGLNVFPVGEMTAAHSYNRYDISNLDTGSNTYLLDLDPSNVLTILFQDGNPQVNGRNGITLEALLEVAKHRLKTFQGGPHACEENELAVHHIGKALEALYSRGRRVEASNQQPSPEPEQGMVDIWMEGYRATGQQSPARLIGRYKAESFDEAREIAYNEASFKGDWNKDKTAIFGCRLFDNEADARKSFG